MSTPLENQSNNMSPLKHASHEAHQHKHDDNDGHQHGTDTEQGWKAHLPLLTGFLILLVMLVAEYGFEYIPAFPYNFIIYAIAYLLAGYNVLLTAFKKILRLDFFNEFFLMSVATIGAFSIGAYSEGVAVMIFYSIGEWFQDSAVNAAKRSIKALLDVRPETVNVRRNNDIVSVHPNKILIDEIIVVKAGEKIALDGKLISENALCNTAALTGESKPDNKSKGDTVLAGMISVDKVIEIQVKALYKDSKLSKILEMVEEAASRKAPTQLFISKFAKIYTPIVFLLAIAVCFLPYFFVAPYIFNQWFYRALVFLVISCPCALVISIPLGYFGGIGLASKNGILFKGANFLDVITKIDTVVMDKTGTITKAVFKVQKVVTDNFDELEMMKILSALEKNSTHPITTAILSYTGENANAYTANSILEISGHGLKGIVQNKEVIAGNSKLFKKLNIAYPQSLDQIIDTIVIVGIDNKYVGHVTISDEIKEDAASTIAALKELNIETVMLSGDKQSVVDDVAKKIAIAKAYGDLLPEGKVEKLSALKKQGKKIAFIGDGINDAPVIALADAGIAMGAIGSDASIETADIVIQNDQLSKVIAAIKIGKITSHIVWQNIALAMIVKVIVLILGAGGLANLWEAVIADVGVALLAILNAYRIQKLQVD